MKRIICLLLIMTMVLGTSSVYAVSGEISSISSNVDILEKEVDDNGEITKSLSKIDKALYLYEKTGDSIISIGVYDNKLADVGIKNINTGEIYSDIIDLNKRIELKTSDKKEMIEVIKKDLLNKKMNLKKLDTKKYFIKEEMISVKNSDADEIMDELYDEGWPTSYSNYLRDSKTVNGAHAELRHSVSYSIREKGSATIVAGATLSAIVLYFTWPAAIWAQIASVVLTGSGIYQAVKSFTISDYLVYAYGNKIVYVNDNYQYQAGRTVKWKAIVADVGATLDFSYDNHNYDYFDNENLLDTGLNNYFN